MNQKKIAMDVGTKADYILIAFTGDLEYGLIEDIKKDLQSLNLETKHGYIIDMQKVTNIDSTGFGMIVNFAKKVSLKEKKIAIIVVDDFIRNLFAISQVDKVFPITNSEEQARKMIKEDWLGELSLNEY
ncbi:MULTISPECIES: STAS domain-containing protein [Lysinibacillus]|uniref:STAS domain-containing protein n=1 Tax=Lysinibacillus pakistanensis TaxID=759811 RepID=A0AAX3X0M4_9BACI|nr:MULTISPECIES: STAS domain-containing protein [Lysinibacillus]MDM5232423.1 STAS domain-containing protein [Lysinibacillus pakistanensis]QGG50588.1 STAS domain-containing protein [Lysinibacillus pakistanensis]WHY47935.1 STAS domain-containing protein [Lysinibacillus pakistanensis]WHY52947.1 STAS domain-containing protein [Lysinibacillus pakistanensis]